MALVVQRRGSGVAGSKISWYQEPGSQSVDDPALLLASEALRDHDDFLNRLRWIFGKNGFKFKAGNTKAGVEQQITEVVMEVVTEVEQNNDSHEALRQQAIGGMSNALRILETYENKRTAGRRKFGRSITTFISGFADFLSVYSGIVELVKDAGQIYGTVAYETLSIFLAVIVNKVNNDSKITELLTELQKSFPQLEDWVDIYPTPPMRSSVAEVYKQVILFARHACRYFTHFSTRFWMALGKPPSLGIDKTAAQIHGKLAEVNSQANIQLHKRSQEIHNTVEENNVHIKKLETSNMTLESQNEELKRSLEGLEKQNGDLKKSIEELKADHKKYAEKVKIKNEEEDKQRLETFKQELHLTYPCDEVDFEICRKSHVRAFSKLPGRARSPRGVEYMQMSPVLLQDSTYYQDWQDRTESCLLFLSGHTQPEGRNGRGYTHSWLSPATTYVTEEMRNQGHKVAYYTCHPGDPAEPHQGKDVLSTIVYQFLEWKPEILRRKYQQFRAMVQSQEWQSEHETQVAAIPIVFQMLREVLLETKDFGTVFIILDRVDQCGWKLHRVMKELVKVVVDDSWKVKILIVYNPGFDRWDTDELEEKEQGRTIVYQDWNQKLLTQLELQKAHGH